MGPWGHRFAGRTSGGITAIGAFGSAFFPRVRPMRCATSPAFDGLVELMRTIG